MTDFSQVGFALPLTETGVKETGLGFRGLRRCLQGTDRQAGTVARLRGPPLTATTQQALTGTLQQASRQPTGQEKFAGRARRTELL